MYWQSYHLADSVEDAVQYLAQAKGQARIIAGGTDLVLQQRRGERTAQELLDITRLSECMGIEQTDEAISIGALVTHAQAAASPLIRSRLPALAEACSQVGSPQIRNAGTVAGNIVSAQPGADAALALHVYGAKVQVAGPHGLREMALADLYAGLGLCCVDSSAELITQIQIPLEDIPTHSAFERLSQRRTLSLPVINAAVGLKFAPDGRTITQARVALGPVAPKPFRATSAEDLLAGSPYSEDLAGQAAELASRDSSPRSSQLRGSAEYRKAMVRVVTNRAIVRAVQGR